MEVAPGAAGSPPLVRGGPSARHGQPSPPGLTPARAGRTRLSTPCTRLTVAHPRSCGADLGLLGQAGVQARLTPARAGRTVRGHRESPPSGAHPRSCGADPERQEDKLERYGSPPLVRGGHKGSRPRRHAAGLTPARAGRTRYLEANLPASYGSPPLVRGGRSLGISGSLGCGLTPARAGRTAWRCLLPKSWTAHPRSCGADEPASTQTPIADGSPPLVRGGHRRGGYPRLWRRLTPARAGRTRQALVVATGTRAHPRSCGADFLSRVVTGGHGGSPPLVRGGRLDPGLLIGPHRLTPARAGRTGTVRATVPRSAAHPRSCGADFVSKLLRLLLRQAHPRSCGADQTMIHSGPLAEGSPPLVRGGQWRPPVSRGRSRLTPARAGRTPSRHAGSRPPPAHPRSCGADPYSPLVGDVAEGSPPLVRGGRGSR